MNNIVYIRHCLFQAILMAVGILVLTPIVSVYGAEDGKAPVISFAKQQTGVTSVISVTVDAYASMGDKAFIAIVIGPAGNEEALQIFGSETIGYTLMSRDPAMAGMIFDVEEGVEFDKALLDAKLQLVVKDLQTESKSKPRSVMLTNLKVIGKKDLMVSVGLPLEYNLVVQCAGPDSSITNHYYLCDSEVGRSGIVKVGSWSVISIR
jgi:hypothetical protein